MNDNPLVSVIVPARNCEEYLPRCVRSVFDQTYDAIELVVVDDGSSDSSPDLLKGYQAEHPSHVSVVVVRNEIAHGVSAARNTAVDAASGTYLFFIDGDDWIEPGCLTDMVRIAREHDLQVCCGTHEYFHTETDRETDMKTGGVDALYESNTGVVRAYGEQKLSTFIWNKLLKRDLFSLGGLAFEETVMNDEDQLWSFRLVTRVERWMTLPKLSYHYRKDVPSSITAESHTMRRLGNYYTVLGFMEEEVGEGVDWSSERGAFLSLGLLNFTKKILWHVECEPDVDYRALYAEFKKKNILRVKSQAYRKLRGKNRVLAWGWNLPYPLNRCLNPYFLHKVKCRIAG